MNPTEFERVVRSGCAPERQKFWRGIVAKGKALAMAEPAAAAKLIPIYRDRLVARGTPLRDAEELAYACLWRSLPKTLVEARNLPILASQR